MALGSQLPVRLEPEVEEKLERVAARIGTSKSALIRLLARTFVEQMVKSATQPASTVQEYSELLLKAARKEKAKTRKQEQERLRPLAEKLEQMKERRLKMEAQLKAASLAVEK